MAGEGGYVTNPASEGAAGHLPPSPSSALRLPGLSQGGPCTRRWVGGLRKPSQHLSLGFWHQPRELHSHRGCFLGRSRGALGPALVSQVEGAAAAAARRRGKGLGAAALGSELLLWAQRMLQRGHGQPGAASADCRSRESVCL